MSSYKEEKIEQPHDKVAHFIFLLLLNHLTISDLDELISDLEDINTYEFKKSIVSKKLLSISRIYAKLLR